MVAAIVGLLTSLPKLIQGAQLLWTWLQKISGNDVAGFIDKSNAAFMQLHQAKTEKEMQDAAKAIQDLIRRTR